MASHEESPTAVNNPSAWNPKDKSPLLEITQGLRVQYRGSGETDKDAAAVKSNHPINPSQGVFYFEVRILNKGRDGFIGIGLCVATASVSRLPGWDKGSYGYHGDDGHSFCCSGTGTKYGPTYTTGDVIGCCVNFLDHTCFFTKNGTRLDIAFRNIGNEKDMGGVVGEAMKLYACVGLRTPGEEIEANFGQRPFVFDIDTYKQEIRDQLQGAIEEIPLPEHEWHSALNQLITSYLVHHGYCETAQTFSRNAGFHIAEPSASILNRRKVRETIVAGHIEEACALIRAHFPDALERNPLLLFQLQCQQFVELVASSSSQQGEDSDALLDALMEFGHTLQQLCDSLPAADQQRGAQLLQEAFGLLAYRNPLSSPLAHLLDPARRDPLADTANSAILQSLGQATSPPLESIVRYSAVCLSEMRRHKVGAAAFLSVDQFLSS